MMISCVVGKTGAKRVVTIFDQARLCDNKAVKLAGEVEGG